MLKRAPWGLVLFAGVIKQFERRAKFAMQSDVVIPSDREPAALLWAVGCESCHDHMTARLHRLHDLLDIGQPIRWISQKVEYRPVMPDIVGLGRKFDLPDVSGQPCHLTCGCAQALARHGKRAC